MRDIEELRIYINILEYLLSSYYEKKMISYDDEVCQWYSRYECRYITFNELEELGYDIISELMKNYHEM